ncbi:type II secretion system F family protein [Roseomonas sp. BN140053]|uniref:type II secretion system F family protein n=1 Tax=Roseomonas sp. BN140053 TaxID=3391898 RepID=UPI0039EB76C8
MRAALLLLFGLVLAGALVAAGLRLLSGSGPNRKLAVRIANVSRPYARVRPVGEAVKRRVGPSVLPPAVQAAITLLFGPQPERRDQYPAAPALLVAASLIPAILLGFYAATLFGSWARLLAIPGWCLCSRFLFGRIHGRRSAALYRQLPDSLAMVVRAVRAGIPVVEALRTVGREVPDPTGTEFRNLSDQIAIGISLDVALRRLAQRSGLAEYSFFAVALTLQNAAGGNLTETLDNLADVVRKRVATQQRGVALASQAKASAYILSAVPVVTTLALAFINPKYLVLLFEDPRGQVIFAAAVGSLCGGLGVMHMIIKRSLS